MATQASTTSRRSLLGAFAVAPMLAVPAVRATASPYQSGWDAALMRFEAADAVHSAAQARYDRVWKRWRQSDPKMDAIDFGAIPHEKWDALLRMDIGAERAKIEGAWLTDEGKARRARALDQIEDYRRRRAANDARYQIDKFTDQVDRSGDALSEAETALMDMPAPNQNALLWKLERVFEVDSDGSMMSWSADYVRQTIADTRRLLSGQV